MTNRRGCLCTSNNLRNRLNGPVSFWESGLNGSAFFLNICLVNCENMISKLIEKVANFIERKFPSLAKEENVIKVIFSVFIAFIVFVTIAGFVISWLTGISWWWIWVGLVIYYFLTVAKHQIDINKRP